MKKYLLEPDIPVLLNTKRFILAFIMLLFLFVLLPWVSFTVGTGQMTAIDPNERVQSITTPINGFIKTWKVKEGDRVKAGDLLAELIDNDPALIERMTTERDATVAALSSAKLMMDTAKINLNRQKTLYEQGLSPRKEYEKAKIEFSKHVVEYQKSLSTQVKAETQLSRQSQQQVLAPRDGTVVRIIPGERGQLIKAGTPIVVFTPDVTKKAAEVWVDGNDASLIKPGMNAQIQFEGWPSIQIPGWPSLAINTFKAKVYLVDQASSYHGMFRVLLIEDEVWPSQNILRLGAKSRAYISLRKTNLLWEIWRQLNRFPPTLEPVKDELNKILSKSDKDEDDEINKVDTK